MKFKFHICCIGMQPKKLMAFGFIIHVNVRKLQISLLGTVFFFSNLVLKIPLLVSGLNNVSDHMKDIFFLAWLIVAYMICTQKSLKLAKFISYTCTLKL